MNSASDNPQTDKRKRPRLWPVLAASLFGLKTYPASFRDFLRRMTTGSVSNKLALLLVIGIVACGAMTYAAMNEAPPFGDDPNTVIWLLNIDLVIVLLLVTLIARRIVGLWIGRRRKVAGSQLHMRLVFVFGLLSAAPAIIMTVFAAFFLHFGVQSWFNDRVRSAVEESRAVAEAYLQEHMQVIRADTLAMANDLNRQAPFLIGNSEAFSKIVQTQSILRNLSEAIVIDANGRVVARSGLTFSLAFETIPDYIMEQANEGEVALMTGENEDRVRALVKLNNFIGGTYLFVGRMVDPTVLSHVKDTRKASQQYEKLESQLSGLQVKVTGIFLVVALLLVFAAVWFGLIFARQLVMPIGAMIVAADRVSAGDLTARVPEFATKDEFDVLARTFNKMTGQIQEQRDQLIAANRQMDRRRRFTETVLSGVSSGVIGLNSDNEITLANAAAASFFGEDAENLTSRKVTDILPPLSLLLEQARQKPGKVTQGEVPYITRDDTRRMLLFRIVADPSGLETHDAVLTFDDLTDLQAAQRKAAWADVARRIAHEIKNPLTPIRLSAERLQRRFVDQVAEGKDIFAKCTDTIMHHVDDIGRMVDEFSNFARMPEPVMKPGDLSRIVQDIVVLQQEARPGISFELRGADGNFSGYFDPQMIRQAFTNVIQNAIESVLARMRQDAAQGRIIVLLTEREEEGVTAVSVIDNGLGLPKQVDPSRLTEPYVTHKEKGTGLGLAIVKKIMEDHHGTVLMNAPEWLKNEKNWTDLGGASVSLVLPLKAYDHENGSVTELKKRAAS